jgi:hypothetical protein
MQVFTSNHLIAVNKPPGWQSVPNISTSAFIPHKQPKKCLLTYLKHDEQGGGLDSSFLLPLHRLDQPCSGLILYGKTSKAASRIQSKWKFVDKTYLVVVMAAALEHLQNNKPNVVGGEGVGLDDSSSCWNELKGIVRGKRPPADASSSRGRYIKESTKRNGGVTGGWSVLMMPRSDEEESTPAVHGRHCRLQWRVLSPPLTALGEPSSAGVGAKSPYALLEVRTNQGYRHMIRALFACHQGPIVGDLRYGAPTGLPDRSVALHARRLLLPVDHIALNLSQRDFRAPIPPLWETYFGFRDITVSLWERKLH